MATKGVVGTPEEQARTKAECWAARDRVLQVREQNQKGQATKAELDAAADAYIAAIKAHAVSTGRRLPVPGRAYLLRAL